MSNTNESNFVIQFPVPHEERIIETQFMREIIRRTLAIHPGNSLWYGPSRAGKTTLARYLKDKIDEAYDPNNPYAFRAVHFEVGEIEAWSGHEQKQGLKVVHNAIFGRIDNGLYRNDPPSTIVEQILHGLVRRNIQIIAIDEAGNLSLDAIRGILMLYDAAKNSDFPLSFIFVGMDDLPVKVTKLPQVNNRIHEWCYFEPYSLEEIAKLLGQLHTPFASLDLANPADYEQVKFIHEAHGGYVGLIIPFIRKLERAQEVDEKQIDITYLRAIHLRTALDKEHCIETSKQLFVAKQTKSGWKGWTKAESGGFRAGGSKRKGGTNEKSKSKR